MSNLEPQDSTDTLGGGFGDIVAGPDTDAETTGLVSEQPDVDATPEPQTSDEPPAPAYLDLEEVADKMVKVKVDGEEVEVPVAELAQGYMRTADYTRKRQADAERLRLAQALENDPRSTVEILARRAGMTVDQYLGFQAQEPVEQPPTDPVERRLWEQDQRVQQLESLIAQQQNDSRVQQGVTGLMRHYEADESEAVQVVQTADALSQQLGREIGPEMFPMILQARRYHELKAQMEGQAQAAAVQNAETQSRQQAAAAASQVVAPGTGAVGTAPVQNGGAGIKTFADALEAAELEVLGGS